MEKYVTTKHRRTRSDIVRQIGVYSLLIVAGVIVLIPLIWMISTMLKPSDEIVRMPPIIVPEHPTIDPLKTAWTELNFPRLYMNTTIMAVGAVVGQLILCSMAGYAFAKIRFAGRQAMFVTTLSTMMMPLQVIVIPLYLIMLRLGWINTYFALFVPWIAHGFGIFLMKQFIGEIPDDLIDAAIIDGCSHYRIYAQIVLPNIKPALATLATFVFMWQWTFYLWPLVAISTKDMHTLTVAISTYTVHLERGGAHMQNLTQSAAFLSSFGPIAVFIYLQKFFLRGTVTTGLKF